MPAIRLSDWLAEATLALERAGVEEPALDSRLLAAHALGKSAAWITANQLVEIGREEPDQLVKRRCEREPLAYITGRRQFWQHEFLVDSRVLIPRQETETLVQAALDWRRRTARVSRASRVLDIGTGSGCVAISLALEDPCLDVTASDVAEGALEVARQNAARLGASIRLVQSDLFESIEREFDLIVSNPPYVESGAILAPELDAWEPQIALKAGPDGMDFYRRFALARPPTQLLVEIGDGQRDRVVEVFDQGPNVEAVDLNGTVRVLGFGP